MIDAKQVKLLGLTRKEVRVLSALNEGHDTPLLIALETRVSRPGVYDILKALKERGIVTTQIRAGRKTWMLRDRREIEQQFFETKRAVLGLHEGAQEVYGVDDAVVIVHRGKDAVRKLFGDLMSHYANERFYGFQGDVQAINWNSVFSVEETNAFNRAIKKNHIIFEGILPAGWFERQTKELGVEWARDFEGRSAETHVIGQEYFKHGGQLFVFKHSMYLIALGEEIVIEIKNSELQKMVLAMFRFIEDNSRTIDVNAILRKLIAGTNNKS